MPSAKSPSGISRRSLLQGAGALGTLLLAGPARAAQPETPRRGGTLRIAMLGLDTSDPHRHTGSIAVQQVYVEALTSIQEDGTVTPFLAETIQASPDAKSYSFRLRDGVRFHNGRVMTAADVLANVERVKSSVKGGWLASAMKYVTAVTAPDPRTVTVTLSQAYAPFLSVLSELWILAPESDGWSGTITRPIGTGPFQFGTWTPKVELVGPAHPQYWQPGRPYAAAVRFDLRDADDYSMGLRAGDLHIARIPREKIKALETDSGTGVQYFKDTTWYFWSFNNRRPRPPFDRVRVREALTYALDKKAYMEFIAGPTGIPTNQMVAPGNFYWDKALHEADRHASPDLAKAKRILQEEGVDPSAITMRVVSWVEPYSQVAVQMVKQLGFKVEHIALDDLGAQKRLGQYDWDLAPFASGPRADVFFRYVRLMSDGPNPVLWGGIQDPELDRLITAAVGTVDAAKRRGLYLEAWQRVMGRYYTVVIGHAAEAIGVRKEVRGYRTGFTWSQHWMNGGLAHTWLAA